MDNNSRIQANASAGIEQTQRARETERQRVDKLAGGPGLVDEDLPQVQQDDEGLRPADSFERVAAEEAAKTAAVKPPVVGGVVPQDAEDVVLPVDGRGAAVALQEYLSGLLKQNQPQQFAATAQALGVSDVEAFERAVEQGHALNTFAAVDSHRLVFTDSNFNEVSAEQLSAVAKAQLVIKPSYEAPVDPEIEAPEINVLDPQRRLEQELAHSDPNEAIRDKQVDPQVIRNDAAVVTG